MAERRGGAADARQRCLHLEAGERRGECGRAAVLLDDDRRCVDGRVVVAVLDEHRDVEQVLVEQTRGHIGHRDIRDDVVLTVDLVCADAGAGLRRLDVDGVRAVGQVGHRHPITGDQRDGVRAAGGRGSGGGCFRGSDGGRRQGCGTEACDSDRHAACGGDDRAQTTAVWRVF